MTGSSCWTRQVPSGIDREAIVMTQVPRQPNRSKSKAINLGPRFQPKIMLFLTTDKGLMQPPEPC